MSALAAFLLAVVYAYGRMDGAWLVAGAFLPGLAYCFALPAFSLLVPGLVPKKDEVRAAMAMNSVSYNIGRAVAPLAAVLIVTTAGFSWAFALNGASFLVLASVLRKVRPLHVPRRDPAHEAGHKKVAAGFRAARRERSIWLSLAMVAAVTMAADPVLVLGGALTHHFGVSGDWAGYFLSALGAGTIFGSVIPIRPPKQLRHAAYPLFLLGLSVVVFALAINPWLCLAMAFVAGIACLLTGGATQALLHALAGPTRAPAVMALWAVAWAGSKPLASLADGLVGSTLSIRVAGVSWRSLRCFRGCSSCFPWDSRNV